MQPLRQHSHRPFTLPAAAATLTLLLVAISIALAPLSWLIATVVITAAALLVLIYPWLAWLGLAFTMPIASGLRIGPASATDLLFAAALAMWCASAIATRNTHATARPPVWAVAVYLLALYLSTLAATNLDEALTEMVKWIEFGILLWVVPMAVPTNRATWLVAALLTAAALQGLYGLYQFIFRIGPDWFLIQGRFMRASGVFGQPNPYGAYLGLSLPVAFSLSIWSLSAWLKQRSLTLFLWTLFYVTVAGCIAIGLVASWSRGGWLGAMASTAVVLAFLNKRTASILGLGLLAIASTALVGAINPTWIPASITARIGAIPAYIGLVDVLSLEVNDDNFAIIERVAHWVAALRMWEMSPWLGVGPGNYATAYNLVALPRWSDPLGHAHNIYLNILGETGLLGFGTFLLMWGSLVAWLHRAIKQQATQQRSPHASWSRALAVGVLGILAHLAVHSFFDNLFVQGMYLHIALWLAAVATTIVTANVALNTRTNQSSAIIAESDG